MIPPFLRAPADIFKSLEEIRARITDSAAPDPPPPVVICPWCPDFDPRQSAGGTHGMCDDCAARYVEDAREGDEGSLCSAACGFCGRCS